MTHVGDMTVWLANRLGLRVEAVVPPQETAAWQVLMLSPEVSLGALAYALRGSGLGINNHSITGQLVIHPTPGDAA